MLSVRLPEPLEAKLTAFCTAQQVSKSSVVQQALEKHLKRLAKTAPSSQSTNPFNALRGTGNCQLSTNEIMQMTRGDDWNQA